MNLLNEILADRTSGASALYKKILNLLQSESRYNSREKAIRVIERIKSQFPEMAVLEYLSRIVNRVNDAELSFCLQKLLSEHSKELKAINDNLKKIWRGKRRIVTFSNSSVVKYILCQNKRRVKSVLLSQASPKNEGILLGRTLAKAGIEVEICSDAALPGLINKSDYLILGADCVTRKYFVNKSGTYPLLLAAKEKNAKSFVLCERFKILPSFKFSTKIHNSSEIARRVPRNIKISNVYFEKIPLSLVDYIISGSSTKK